MEANVWHGVNDILTIELEHDAEHAVCSRVLWTNVEEHEVGVFGLRFHAPLFWVKLQRGLFAIDLLIEQSVRPYLGCARRMFFAKRMAFPGCGHQDSPEVGVSVKAYSKHVIDLAFIPVDVRPESCSRRRCGIFTLECYFYSDKRIAGK